MQLLLVTSTGSKYPSSCLERIGSLVVIYAVLGVDFSIGGLTELAREMQRR